MELDPKTGSPVSALLSVAQTNAIYDPPFTPQDGDSIERITVLGSQEPNPYLIPNMQQAYLSLGYNPNLATVNNLYVRFNPTTSQVAALDSIMDAQGLDLFDTPMDYDVTYEGDYYQDPSIPDSLPTWQYAVVPPNFVFPSGITYQTLAQIHIPPDAYTAVETAAENIAGGGVGAAVQSRGTIPPPVPQCPPGYHWDFTTASCVACPGGYQWNGTACVPYTCPTGYYYNGVSCVPYNTTPPAPAADAQIPAGSIKVHDTNLATDVAIRNARMVARRWFKVDHAYTDINGNFTFTKHYRNKVRVILKFKNGDAQVRNIRSIRFWQMFFAVKRELGIFGSDKSNILYTATQFPDYTAKGNIFWTAATVHNSVEEYRDYASNTEHIGLPPQGLKIFISRLPLIGSGGATPLFAKRQVFSLSTQFVLAHLSSVASIVYNIIAIVKGQFDMIIGYRYINRTSKIQDINQLLSDRIKETTFHELTHAAHYLALGNLWYTSFVNAEEYEIISNLSSGYIPYGDGTNSTYSPIIALGESWAEYIGQYLADKKYGQTSSEDYFSFGGGDFSNNNPINLFSSHLNVLENFDPTSTAHFHWIPVGLYYDMMDTRNDKTAVPWTGINIDDQVSGYTNQQFFKAFSSSIGTLGSYKTNLLQQNSNNQATQVNSLFTQYGF
jgi:hypothetical protein